MLDLVNSFRRFGIILTFLIVLGLSTIYIFDLFVAAPINLPLVTRIGTDVGQVSIPNSAIASGVVIVTTVRKYEAKSQSRLSYSIGDRVVTTYMKEEGLVKELIPFHTTILLDSGKELTFLNNSVLSGAVAIASVTQTKYTQTQTREKG